MAEGRNFDLEIITPDRGFYQGQGSMIEFNTTEVKFLAFWVKMVQVKPPQ